LAGFTRRRARSQLSHRTFRYRIFRFNHLAPSSRSGTRSVWVQPREHRIIGACLADGRRRAKLTQQEPAKRLGKPQSFVSDYEDRRRSPPPCSCRCAPARAISRGGPFGALSNERSYREHISRVRDVLRTTPAKNSRKRIEARSPAAPLCPCERRRGYTEIARRAPRPKRSASRASRWRRRARRPDHRALP
jgi:hypothetical protein